VTVVRAFLAVVAFLRSATMLEAIAAGLLIAGVAVLWGLGAALIAGGVCGALKAFEMDAKS
jgi:predicted phage tail protein